MNSNTLAKENDSTALKIEVDEMNKLKTLTLDLD